MKRRIRKIVNFFAFNLLFFALYLNFIHKDRANGDVAPAVVSSPASNAAAYSGTVLVQNPEKYLRKEEEEEKNKNQQQ
ncbi:MAG TPA: hypothetical protein VFU29_24795 [Chitinophagaceae bacterium]|nr:hypothetical protein [Chitinophagaceae bacterium]